MPFPAFPRRPSPAQWSLRAAPRPGLALAAALLLLAGCATPRDVQTPPADEILFEDGQPRSRLMVQERAAGGANPFVARPGHADWSEAAVRQVRQLPASLADIWRSTQLSESALSLVILEPGQIPWVAIQPEQPRNPASLMKLVTTYAALEGLGPSYRWRTEAGVAPGTRVDASGTLLGPLYIRAAGDPWLEPEDVWRLLRDLRQQGVRRLPEIVIDRSVFGNVAIDPGAFDNAPERVYNASPDALLVGFGASRLSYRPDPASGRWRVTVEPPLPDLALDVKLTARKGACQGPRAVSVKTVSDAARPTVRIAGSVPASCGPFDQYRLLVDPPAHTAQLLRSYWRELGGELDGPIRDGAAPTDLEVFAFHESNALADVIRPVNKSSNNVMARHLLLALGQARSPLPATAASGAAALREVLREQGLEFPELRLENGAGLSRDERIAAGSMARLLERAWFSPRMPEFVSSLAIAGSDGTVHRRWRDDEANGRAHLKTGTLRDTTGLAGYVQGNSGRRYLMVAMVNDPKAYNARRFLDATVEWLARQ